MVKKLFVSFSYINKRGVGFGNSCLDDSDIKDFKIEGSGEIEALQQFLEMKLKHDKVIISNFRRME